MARKKSGPIGINDYSSRLLGKGYVFYNYLGKTAAEKLSKRNQILRKNAEDRLNSLNEMVTNSNSSVTLLQQMANAEKKKEISLINQYFGWNKELNSKTDINELVKAYNSCLNLKKAFERSYKLIENTEGQKGVYSFFGDYFVKAVERNEDKLNKIFEKDVTGLNNEKEITQFVDLCTQEALSIMINEADVEPGLKKTDPQLKSAYQELNKIIGSIKQQGNISQIMYQTYQLDEVKDYLLKELNRKGRASSFNTKKNKITELMKKNFFLRSGGGAEAFRKGIVDVIAQDLESTNVTVIHTGSKGYKPDVVYTIGINFPKEITDIIQNNNTEVSRANNIKVFQQVYDKLKQFDEGFIVYDSVKNYSYNENFKTQGGMTLESIKAINLYSAMRQGNINNFGSFLDGLLNLAHGALNGDDPNKRKQYREILAQNVAYFMFDDFAAIGSQMTKGADAVHLFTLNGVVVPLSVVLQKLVDAMKTVERQYTSFVSINLQIPDVLVPDQKTWEKYEDNPTWDEQRTVALNKTVIKVKMLSSFKKFIEDMAIQF